MPDMRFAPPSVRVNSNTGGMNQIIVRSYNERLVLSLIRKYSGLSRQQIGQKSGLSAQAVSVIVRALEKDGLIIQGEKRKGRVGPPTMLMNLNSEGAFSVGVEFKGLEGQAVLVDFTGTIIHKGKPIKSDSFESLQLQLSDSIAALLENMSSDQHSRLVGIGIAMINSENEDNIELGKMVESTLFDRFQLPVYIQDDLTCAASAEVSLGEARFLDDFLYLFVDEAIGSRLVLGNHIYAERSWLSFKRQFPGGLTDYLLSKNQPQPDSHFWPDCHKWELEDEDKKIIWANECSKKLIEIIGAALMFVNIKTVVIDARLPNSLTKSIVENTEAGVGELSESLEVISGSVGLNSKIIGAAKIPISFRHLLENKS